MRWVELLLDIVADPAGTVMACIGERGSGAAPRPPSGKILRGTIRHIADGEEYRVPSTIDDPDILGEIEDAVETIGYGKK